MCFPDTHTIPVMSSTFQLNIKLNKNKKQWCKGIYSSTLKLLFWKSSEYLERYLTVLNHLKLNWVPIKKGLFTKEAHILCLISAGWSPIWSLSFPDVWRLWTCSIAAGTSAVLWSNNKKDKRTVLHALFTLQGLYHLASEGKISTWQTVEGKHWRTSAC